MLTEKGTLLYVLTDGRLVKRKITFSSFEQKSFGISNAVYR